MSKFITILLSGIKKAGNILLKLFKWVFSKVERVIIAVLLVLLCVFAIKYKSMERDYNKLTVDYINSQDTVMTYKNKLGESYSMVQMLITDKNTLKRTNAELYTEIKNLKDNPLIVTKTEIVYKIDTLQLNTDTVYVNPSKTEYTNYFSYDDTWCNIRGHNVLNIDKNTSRTLIDSLSMSSSLYVDVIEKDKSLMFITRADNPYLQINNIDGAVVSPENSKVLKKKFNKPWGVMIGVGPSVTVMNNTVKVYPAVQLTLGYKIISF